MHHSPEGIPQVDYLDVLKKRVDDALMKEEKIMLEINKILRLSSDRARVEKVIIEQYGEQIELARKKANEAIDSWFGAIKESLAEKEKAEK